MITIEKTNLIEDVSITILFKYECYVLLRHITLVELEIKIKCICHLSDRQSRWYLALINFREIYKHIAIVFLSLSAIQDFAPKDLDGHLDVD